MSDGSRKGSRIKTSSTQRLFWVCANHTWTHRIVATTCTNVTTTVHLRRRQSFTINRGVFSLAYRDHERGGWEQITNRRMVATNAPSSVW